MLSTAMGASRRLGLSATRPELRRIPSRILGSAMSSRKFASGVPSAGKKVPMEGNECAAYVATALSEVAMIYPITPSTTMGEMVDEWAAQGRVNIFGQPLSVTEMQSEAGAAGALHGSCAAGSLATTFTASQGLLLMTPNLYKIAGELMPCVIHVAARALAGQALCIYGDHADVMAVRSAGCAMLASGTVQEVMDLGTVAHLASLKASLPFIHFFEGFRVSAEVNTVDVIPYDTIRSLVDMEAVKLHRSRALNPDHPHLRGTSQTPDVFFQMVEAANPFYDKVPAIVEQVLGQLEKAVGRKYGLFDYFGAPDAENVCVVIGSGSTVMEAAAKYINEKGNSKKCGVLKVRLFRPFSVEHFLAKLPKSVKRVAVLDRCKEPGAPGEPLYLDVRSALYGRPGIETVVGGRYGLGSKDFTPSMAKAVFDNLLLPKPKVSFSVGISDDVTNRSLPWSYDSNLESHITPPGTISCMFWGLGADGTVGSNKSAVKTIVNNTELHGQGYFYYSAHKSGGLTISHLRFGPNKIEQPYLLQEANYVACHTAMYIDRYGAELIRSIAEGGTFVLNCPWSSVDELAKHLPKDLLQMIGKKKVKLFTIDASKIAADVGMPGRTNSVLQAVFFNLANFMSSDQSVKLLKKSIEKDYGKKGKKIVEANWAAVDVSIQNLKEVKYPSSWAEQKFVGTEVFNRIHRSMPAKEIPSFIKNVMFPMIELKGDELPVSVFPAGGMIPLGTSQWEKRGIADNVPKWLPDKCSQCSYCALVCPHACIRPFLVTEEEKKQAPKGFDSRAAVGGRKVKGFDYRIQTSVLDCTGCNLCAKTCPDEALVMEPLATHVDAQADIWDWISKLPHRDATGLGVVKESQFKHPYLEFSGACGGCAQTNVVKLVTQFFGESMIIANATGCSTIWGGTFPNSPYTVDERGYGPAWANSLFEDNAEFGLGIYKAHSQRRVAIKENVDSFLKSGKKLDAKLKASLEKLVSAPVFMDREKSKLAAEEIKTILKTDSSSDAAVVTFLKDNSDMLAKKSQWIFGGDGWAYDIGFGGLDHVIATGEDVNVLVLDTEVYSNTGGQRSKSTSRGAVAKFCANGKETSKKDLGRMMMGYGNVYVASAALGADMKHMIKCIKEAESWNGPSLVMTYTTCIAHGIKGVMNEAIDEQKLAVDSGYWMLYRYDPRRKDQGLNPLVIDMPEPNFEKLNDFLQSEVRFTALERQNEQLGKEAQAKLREDLEMRWKEYKSLAADPKEAAKAAAPAAAKPAAAAPKPAAAAPKPAAAAAPKPAAAAAPKHAAAEPAAARPVDSHKETRHGQTTAQIVQGRRERGRPIWDPTPCEQCGVCHDQCPQGAIHCYTLPKTRSTGGDGVAMIEAAEDSNSVYSIQVNEWCNGCGDCVEACKSRGNCLQMVASFELEEVAKKGWEFIVGYPKWDPAKCTQCDKCVPSCNYDALSSFELTQDQINVAPKGLVYTKSKKNPSLFYTIQTNHNCVGCNDCVNECEDIPDFEGSCLELVFDAKTKNAFDYSYKFAKNVTGTHQVNEIIRVDEISDKIVLLEVKAPNVAKYAQAGQFVVVHLDETAERIPLTIADFNRSAESVTLVIQRVGESSEKLCNLKAGAIIQDILGPVGRPTHVEKFGTVVIVGGGLGIAPIHPIARALKEAGNHTISIIGSRNKDLLFWESEMRKVSDELIVMTDDGSYGKKGFVSQGLEELVSAGKKIDHVWAVGPVVMMNAVCNVSKKYNLPTEVSVNSLMVDATGMCAACRVTVDGKVKFTCVDGPEFDGLKLDFKELMLRQTEYKAQEKDSMDYMIQCQSQAKQESLQRALTRIPMPELDPDIRVNNFEEVSMGYTPQMAIAEANRCLLCKNASCMRHCPVNINIPGFIGHIQKGDFLGAVEKIKEKNCLPAITGRVCPQETQCEGGCIFSRENEEDEPIAIGRLERFVADWQAKNASNRAPFIKSKKTQKVAVVGSGPAGLAVAGDLAKTGYNVTVFEALHKLGGVLVYGIPEFRLPKTIVVRECDYLEEMGVKFKNNTAIGFCGRVQDLLAKEGFDAVFLGLGAGAPNFLGIPGENLKGVLSSNEFLTRVNLMKAYLFPQYETPVTRGKNIAVIGAGNVAMDAARVARRLGPDNVYLVYRRSIEEATAREEEIHHALQEGVKLLDLTLPKRLIADDSGKVKGMEVIKMELGAKDAGGRRKPIEVKGSEKVLDVDMVIPAIGNGANTLLTQTFPELKLNKWGNIVADERARTSYKGVFAGGDIVTGAATVIEAMGAGKIAAAAIDDYLQGKFEWPKF